jgi:hypothetical protein
MPHIAAIRAGVAQSPCPSPLEVPIWSPLSSRNCAGLTLRIVSVDGSHSETRRTDV